MGTAQTNDQTPLHFEKGQAYVPVDMRAPEFNGLEAVVQEKGITSGDYRWDATQQELIAAGGTRI